MVIWSQHQVREAIQKQSLLNPSAAPVATQHLYKLLDTVLARPRDSSRSSGLQFFWEHSLNQGLDLDSAMQAEG